MKKQKLNIKDFKHYTTFPLKKIKHTLLHNVGFNIKEDLNNLTKLDLDEYHKINNI